MIVSENKKAKSVACLLGSFLWFFFAVNDGLMLVMGNVPDIMPAESIKVNCVIFSIIGTANIVAWRNSGSHTPSCVSNMIATGELGLPINLTSANLKFFGLWMAVAPG